MLRSLTQKLSERLGESNPHSGALDPDLLARNFGVVATVGEPPPEAESPLIHAEDDDSYIKFDQRAAKPEPPRSLESLAVERLRSLKPRTPERRAQVMKVIGASTAVLKAIDLLVEEMEQERFAAIDARWEEIRKQGRILLDSMPKLQKELAVCMNRVNASASAKSDRRADLETWFEERKHLSRFATEAEIRAANLKVAQAKDAARNAADDALTDQQELAAAEAALATCKANLQTHQTELSRLEAELTGQNYFDPETGLSSSPVYYRNRW